MLPPYARVRLLSERFSSEGATPGMIGYVIEVYDDGNYEVEFSDATGVTLAQLVVNESDVELAPEPSGANGGGGDSRSGRS